MNLIPPVLAERLGWPPDTVVREERSESWLVLNRLFHVVLRQYLDTLPGCVSIVTFSIVGKEQNV